MPKHRVRLKKTIIAVLKDNDDRPLSAEQLIHLCQQKGLNANYLPKNTNAMGQIMRQVKGVVSQNINMSSNRGNYYVSAVYSLESEEAFNEWLEKVS